MGFIITRHISYSQVVAILISLQASIIKERVYFFNHICFLSKIISDIQDLSTQTHRNGLNGAPNVIELASSWLSQRLTVRSYPYSRSNVMSLKFRGNVVPLGKYLNKINHNYDVYVCHCIAYDEPFLRKLISASCELGADCTSVNRRLMGTT
jgi:hypothetical protein